MFFIEVRMKEELFFSLKKKPQILNTGIREKNNMNIKVIPIKRLYLLFLVFFFFNPVISSGSEGKSYTSSVKRYFAGNETNDHRGMVLYLGSSIYSDDAIKDFKRKPFSSWVLGFQQQIKEVSDLGDFSLKTELQNFRLTTGRATQINITPVFSLPEGGNGFPVYVGLGAGLGFYPYHILKGNPFFSLNTQFFVGLRLANLYKNLGLHAELALYMHIPFQDNRLYMDTIASLGVMFSF